MYNLYTNIRAEWNASAHAVESSFPMTIHLLRRMDHFGVNIAIMLHGCLAIDRDQDALYTVLKLLACVLKHFTAKREKKKPNEC